MYSVLGNESYCNQVKDFAFMCEDVEDAPGGGEAPGWHLLLLHLQMSVEGGDQKKVRIKAEDVKCRCPSTWVPPEPWAANQKPANSHLIKFDQWDVEQSIIESKHGTMGIESKAPPGDAGGREAGRSQTLQVRLTNPLAKLLVQEQRRCHHLIPNSYLRNVLPLIEDEDPAVVGTLPSCSWECHIPTPPAF